MHNPNLIPKKHPMNILFGQRPLTKFKDYRKSIKVDLIESEAPDKIMKRLYDFVKATWSEDGRDSERARPGEMVNALQQMLSGKALGLGLETINFTFRISGISRIDTHQIVRQRIGVTFSQQCSGDRFLNHNDILVEESIAQDSEILQSFIVSSLNCKNTYAELNDSQKVSIQAARAILPHNLETFIFMNTNLLTLLFFHQKRIDDGSQTWQINEIAQQMADRVSEIYPELKEVFEKNKTKFKFQKEAGADRNNLFSTSLYIPKFDEFEYHLRDFLYPQTKIEMNYTNTPINPVFYWGTEQITEQKFNKVKVGYSEIDNIVKQNHFSNEEILELNRNKTKELEYEN